MSLPQILHSISTTNTLGSGVPCLFWKGLDCKYRKFCASLLYVILCFGGCLQPFKNVTILSTCTKKTGCGPDSASEPQFATTAIGCKQFTHFLLVMLLYLSPGCSLGLEYLSPFLYLATQYLFKFYIVSDMPTQNEVFVLAAACSTAWKPVRNEESQTPLKTQKSKPAF